MSRMSQIRIQDRPREKLPAKGAAALSDFESRSGLRESNELYLLLVVRGK